MWKMISFSYYCVKSKLEELRPTDNVATFFHLLTLKLSYLQLNPKY